MVVGLTLRRKLLLEEFLDVPSCGRCFEEVVVNFGIDTLVW